MTRAPRRAATPGGERPIRFGTSGWRGILGDEVTLPRVARAVGAAARWLRAGGRGDVVLVGHDTRPQGALLAEVAASVLAQEGFTPRRARGAVPTPVVARAVLRERAAGALVFTASHNPPAYHGMKLIDADGGAADSEATARIEGIASRLDETLPAQRRQGRGVDLCAPYVGELSALLDGPALRRASLQVTYDAMHGAGAAVFPAVMRRAGVSVSTRRTQPHPHFGGVAPDPRPASLAGLSTAVRRGTGLRLGVATDGDGDRYAVVDSDGRVLSEADALALLVAHLVATGRLRSGDALAVSLATGSLVEQVARDAGLDVRRVPLGFKCLARELLAGRAQAAGEESGGFAWGAFGRDKDGMLANALLAERVALDRAPLGHGLAQLRRRFGARAWGRTAVPASPAALRQIAQLEAAPPQRLDGGPVSGTDRRDGVRFELADGFLMLRTSGTEPLVRIYAEAPTPAALKRRFRVAVGLLAPPA